MLKPNPTLGPFEKPQCQPRVLAQFHQNPRSPNRRQSRIKQTHNPKIVPALFPNDFSDRILVKTVKIVKMPVANKGKANQADETAQPNERRN